MSKYQPARRFSNAGARRTIKRPGEMNTLEAKYAAHLGALKESGAILDFGYEPLKIKLADKTYYSPDFMILALDGSLEFHEVKARWKHVDKKTKVVTYSAHVEASASIKMKLAADIFPAKFIMLWFVKEFGWQSKEF